MGFRQEGARQQNRDDLSKYNTVPSIIAIPFHKITAREGVVWAFDLLVS